MSTKSIAEISDKSGDSLYLTNELQDVSNKYKNSDPIVVKLSTIVCSELQEKKDKQKQNQVAAACVTIFTCVLCVAMSVVIITKILDDEDRTKYYDTLSKHSSSKVYKDQIGPNKPKMLIMSSNPEFQPQIILLSSENEASLNSSTTETSVNNELITPTSESYVAENTQDPVNDMNDIPTVEPLEAISSGNLNFISIHVLCYFFIVLLICKF